ncbi:MAG: sigma-70 family RNA polymerase sigma factor [Myxococcota bacterium]
MKKNRSHAFEKQQNEPDSLAVVGSSNLPVKRESSRLASGAGEWLHADGDRAKDSSGSSHEAFVRKATSIARLTQQQEQALGYRVRDHHDQKAAQQLVLHNLRLAIKLSYQYHRHWTNIMDLIQEASLGIHIAAQRWDPDKGTRFGTYAAYWIRAQVGKFLMTNNRLIHTANTRSGRNIYFNLPAARKKLLQAGRGEPTIDEIAQQLNEDPREVELVMARLQANETSLSSPVDGVESLTVQDTLASQHASPESRVAQTQLQDLLKILVVEFETTLTDPRDKTIWQQHLVAQNPVSLVELGKHYGTSKQRIGQIATKLRRAFRCYIVDRMGPHTQLSWLFTES